MAVEITPDDLILSEVVDEDRALDLISTAIARASLFAPCILTVGAGTTLGLAAKGILVDVISRRYEAQRSPGPGNSETVGGRTLSVNGNAVVTFWPGEISELQALCASTSDSPSTPGPVYSFPDAPRWPDGLCG